MGFSDNLPYEKVGKNEPVCIADEVPFDIPESWEWVRFKNLVSYNMGKTPPRKESEYWENATYPWVSIADLVLDDTVCVTKEHVNEHSAKVIFKNHISKAGTLLMSFKLTVGKVSILGMDAFHNEAIISIYPFCDVNRVITNYLFATLPLLSQNGNTKTAIKGATLNSDSLDALLIPVPPIKEQIRICEKIKALKNILSIYTNLEQSLTRLNDTFPLQLKKSILQYAIQGKLVPQDPADEPASALLERIRAEKEQFIKEGKIKRDKHESVIFRRDNSYYEKVDGIERCIDDELPFEIPENWEWVRFFSIVEIATNLVSPERYFDYMHRLFEVDSVQDFYLVAILQHGLPTFENYRSFRVSDHIGAVALQEIRFQPKARLTAARATDYQHIFVSGVLGVRWAIAHHQTFRFCQDDVIGKLGSLKRLNILGGAPSCRAVLHSMTVLLCIFAPQIYGEP